MMKKFIFILVLTAVFSLTFQPSYSAAADYGRKLTQQEKFGSDGNGGLCAQLKSIRQQKAQNSSADSKMSSVGGGIIPDTVLFSIYNATHKISDSVSIVMVLGQALTCNAVFANKQSIKIFGLTLATYPNIPVWLTGAVIFFFGFMLTLSITFYLVDISFKLGFAVIMLPIGVALWPFPATKDKLATLIGIILKSAGIFVFLGMTVAYALNLIGEAGGGLEEIFDRIDRNETDTISESFSLASTNFLIILFALMYGMKLIGSTITDYVDKFFKDGAFGSASPMHGSMTQAMDFAKKKTVDPIASWAGDVAKTQTGRLTAGTGKLMTGGYNQQLRQAAHYATHPGEAIDQGVQAAGRLTASVTGGTAKLANAALIGGVGRIVLGKNASQDLQQQLNQQIDEKVVGGINKVAQKAGAEIGGGITSVTDKMKETKVGKGISKTANAVGTARKAVVNTVKAGYNRAVGTLDDTIEKIDNLKDKWRESVDNSLPNTGNDGAAKKALRAVLKAPSGIVSSVAKMPVKIVRTAVKATDVKAWTNFTGEVLQNVGDKMQRNRKTPEQRRAEAARKEAEQLKREEEERLSGKNWGDV